MINIGFDEIVKRMHALSLPEFDLVIGIGFGGIVPASLIAYKLKTELYIMYINYRDETNKPCRQNPILLSEFNCPEGIRSILLIEVKICKIY